MVWKLDTLLGVYISRVLQVYDHRQTGSDHLSIRLDHGIDGILRGTTGGDFISNFFKKIFIFREQGHM